MKTKYCKGEDIRMDHKQDMYATTRIIDSMGVGIPLALSLREIGINGIEANLRNKEEDRNDVYVMKDHIYKNKLCVINAGGDFLSEENFRNHLATLGSSGNIEYSNDGDTILDDNKGVGAKIAILPQMKLGLVYRSKTAGDVWGIRSRMWKDPQRNVYTLPAEYCEELEQNTSYPLHCEFSELLDNATGTEVVCMGNSEDENTFDAFDRACGIRQGGNDGGSGYGIFKYYNHRFFDKPQSNFRVAIYGKSNDSFRWAKVKGLKSIIYDRCKLNGSIKLTVGGVPVTAHWGVLYAPGETKEDGKSGYVSNWASYGMTAFAWKGETYFDFHQHHNSKRKDVKECGIPIKPEKIMIVFEIDRKTQLNTNSQRTALFHKNKELDKYLFHEEFSKNLPNEIKQWMKDNTKPIDNEENIDKFLDQKLKEMRTERSETMAIRSVKSPSAAVSTKQSGKTLNSKKMSYRGTVGNRRSSSRNLKACQKPQIIYINNEDDPLAEFNYNSYSLTINQGSASFKGRVDRITDKFDGVCLVKDMIENSVTKHLAWSCIERVFEISDIWKEASLESQKEKWRPDSLESCWSGYIDIQILKECKKHQKDMIKIQEVA
jgi:hypothetical protein